MKFAVLAALVATASAGSMTLDIDTCRTDSDCPPFFAGHMKCATAHESGFKYTSDFKYCIIEDMCGFEHKGRTMDDYYEEVKMRDE